MAKANEAVENVKSLARTFQSVIDLADALGEVANIDNAVNERKSIIAKLDVEIATRKDEEAAAHNAVLLLETKAKTIISEAEVVAAEIRTKATAEAAEVVAKTDAIAAKTMDNVKAVDKDLNDKVSAVNALLDGKYAELQEVEAKLEKARASVAKLLGQ